MVKRKKERTEKEKKDGDKRGLQYRAKPESRVDRALAESLPGFV